MRYAKTIWVFLGLVILGYMAIAMYQWDILWVKDLAYWKNTDRLGLYIGLIVFGVFAVVVNGDDRPSKEELDDLPN